MEHHLLYHGGIHLLFPAVGAGFGGTGFRLAGGRRRLPVGERGIRPEMGFRGDLNAMGGKPAVVSGGPDVRRFGNRLCLQSGTGDKPLVRVSCRGRQSVAGDFPELQGNETVRFPEQFGRHRRDSGPRHTDHSSDDRLFHHGKAELDSVLGKCIGAESRQHQSDHAAVRHDGGDFRHGNVRSARDGRG